ncbi:Rne/Rng family ribonuclease [Roseibaca sp. V10]|uniref:Ribonuclease E n=1 Tax=Roseinatronobacter domitianus TaxID=2940293 RepID=A0ABT0M4C1_9RHOB|nr:ribonuclease E/G [Roseibaca domitiana]MCL1629700.1 Rne/Rng family ribonuclease [Roseibaca domitiana]
MSQKMLIDATHAEETRVVVVDGNKVEEFDFETASRRQLAGNIYLAKVTRVEPSLQAAFVDYGGNRHGFLAFNEIHPDYYQIPAADRAALLEEERALAADAEDDDAPKAEKPARKPRRSSNRRKSAKAETVEADDQVQTGAIAGMDIVEPSGDGDVRSPEGDDASATVAEQQGSEDDADNAAASDSAVGTVESAATEVDTTFAEDDSDAEAAEEAYVAAEHASDLDDRIESVSDGDPIEEARPRRKPRMRRYKIQEVIKVRQIMLVQVVKEERGNKGAALTTYLSLAGRYCVLMPNTARGGGISRKITNAADRQKLKAIAGEIIVPEGAGLIIRTAGANRTRAEIKRDYEYLLRLWEQIRDLTLKSIAPTPIYEEGNLIKRSIRDLYSKNIEEVLVEGEAGYRVAKDFMKMIMPSHAKNVKLYDEGLPLFARYQVETTLTGMFNPTVQLPSGGYIVIGITEALVAIDINSGRATREGSIEDTAVKTNLEAAAEIARQLRLRDLAGLIVIDFIDMEERKNNAAVEKMLKDKLKSDRARIQVGRISGFGLLEMSRQRLRPGMLEATTQPCAHCHGTGLIRSDDSMALTVLRQIEEEGTRGKSLEVLVRAPAAVINFLFNYKREHLAQIEARFGMAVRLEADPSMISPDFVIEKFKTATRVPTPQAAVVSMDSKLMPELEEELEEPEAPEEDAEATSEPKNDTDDQPRKKRRRRRRRRGGKDGETGSEDATPDSDSESGPESVTDSGTATEADAAAEPDAIEAAAPEAAPAEKPKRKRASRAKKPVAEAAVEAEGVEAPAADGSEAVAEKKPARRSRSRRKPVAAADAPVESSAEPATDQPAETTPGLAPEAAEASASDTVQDAPVAEPAAETTPASKEPVPAPVAVEDAPIPATVDTVADTSEPEAPEAEAPEAEATEAATPEPASSEAPAPVAEKPRRRGWWSR